MTKINFQGRCCRRPVLTAQDSVLRLREKADFTNEMGIGVGMRTGQKQWASVPMLLKTAIHGGFSLDVNHFISEIDAFSQ